MVRPISTQKRFSWYVLVRRRDNTNVAKEVTTKKVGGTRGRPRLRWMDSAEQFETTPARSKAGTETRSMDKDSNVDRPRTGIRSARVSKGEQSQWHTNNS